MAKNIKLTFLGTADAVPSAKRNSTAVLLSYFGENILIDCGEGTQRQFRKAKLNPCKITRILITHLHGDHILGLAGLIETLNFSGYNKILYIYGPKKIKSFMKLLFSLFRIKPNFKIKVEEVNGVFFENNEFVLSAEKMTHRIDCNAYCLKLKEEIKIDKSKLKKYNIKEGSYLAELKLGKNIVYNGKKYNFKELTFKENSKKICFVFDTSENSKIAKFVKNSNIFVCEANFDSSLKEHAKQYGHLTAENAGKIAKKAKAKKLVLTHISQRYDKNQKIILDEAKKYFDNSFIAKDFDIIEI